MTNNSAVFSETALTIGNLATSALLYEAVLTPKPGLVDQADNGAHHDMNLTTFIASATALGPYFVRLVQIGVDHAAAQPSQLFALARKQGLKMDQAMLTATGGINTHKGAIFTFALNLVAVGQYCALNQPLKWQATDTTAVLTQVKLMATPLKKDFEGLNAKPTTDLSYGEKLYLTAGITGIRGEAMAGYPSIMDFGLPKLRTTVDEQRSMRLLDTFLVLLANVTDSNIIHRSNLDMLLTVQKEVRNLLNAGGVVALGTKPLQELNKRYIARNISPGGTADLLAMTIFYALLEEILD